MSWQAKGTHFENCSRDSVYPRIPWNTTVTIAQATRSRVSAFGLEFDNTGKNRHAAPFSRAV